MSEIGRALLVLLGLLVLWGLSTLVGMRLTTWPRTQKLVLRFADMCLSITLAVLAISVVILSLRELGWLPPRR